jgi:heme/copper-type cytochrome/quinol oxidase subunit 2
VPSSPRAPPPAHHHHHIIIIITITTTIIISIIISIIIIIATTDTTRVRAKNWGHGSQQPSQTQRQPLQGPRTAARSDAGAAAVDALRGGRFVVRGWELPKSATIQAHQPTPPPSVVAVG